ncbi:MAG: hypothetical protein M5U12_18120 [Verrucomicrobia bacterium]|nr:hypothetical protein [Verrucomicrobiota bacterium]
MNPILHAFLPVVTAYYLKRHGGIWGLKRLIFGRDDRPLAQHAYYYYLARYGSWIGHNSRLAGPVCFPTACLGSLSRARR